MQVFGIWSRIKRVEHIANEFSWYTCRHVHWGYVILKVRKWARWRSGISHCRQRVTSSSAFIICYSTAINSFIRETCRCNRWHWHLRNCWYCRTIWWHYFVHCVLYFIFNNVKRLLILVIVCRICLKYVSMRQLLIVLLTTKVQLASSKWAIAIPTSSMPVHA